MSFKKFSASQSGPSDKKPVEAATPSQPAAEPEATPPENKDEVVPAQK